MFNIAIDSWQIAIATLFYIEVLRPWYKNRESIRIEKANNDIIKILIFHIIEDKEIEKIVFAEMYSGILAKYNINSSLLYPIERAIQETHRTIVLDNQYTDEQRTRFYKNFHKRESQIFSCTPPQEIPKNQSIIKRYVKNVIFSAFFVFAELYILHLAIKFYGEAFEQELNVIWSLLIGSLIMSLILCGLDEIPYKSIVSAMKSSFSTLWKKLKR